MADTFAHVPAPRGATMCCASGSRCTKRHRFPCSLVIDSLRVTDEMLRGPWAIVQHMSRTLRRGTIVRMRDASGEPRFVHNAKGVIPAGSIILTGTPGGTAIREPSALHKAALFVRGGFSISGAKRTLISDMGRDIAATGYLQPGDGVESWIEGLGRQRWQVVASRGDASRMAPTATEPARRTLVRSGKQCMGRGRKRNGLIGFWLTSVLFLGCDSSPPMFSKRPTWHSTQRRVANAGAWQPTAAAAGTTWRALHTCQPGARVALVYLPRH